MHLGTAHMRASTVRYKCANDEANEKMIGGDPDTRHVRYCIGLLTKALSETPIYG